ncbi:hypothetical protein ACLIA0_08115 [Bacillaceae bacterium W0354]
MTGAFSLVLTAVLILSLLPSVLNQPNDNISTGEVLEMIENDLEIGMSMSEVESILGTDYSDVLSAMGEDLMWRYDINAISNYQFDEPYDFADKDGLRNGDIDMQIWVQWNHEEKIESVSAIYINSSNEMINVRKDSNGTIQENVMNTR